MGRALLQCSLGIVLIMPKTKIILCFYGIDDENKSAGNDSHICGFGLVRW